jgi:hypothetical protein
MSELFGLKWGDIDFQKNEISVTRSIVFQVVGPCKTEASQKTCSARFTVSRGSQDLGLPHKIPQGG